jgi:hypothetical protein
MNTGLYRIEWTGLPGLGDWPSRRPAGHSKIGLIGSAVALAAVCWAGMLLSGEFGDGAEGEPALLVAVTQPDRW